MPSKYNKKTLAVGAWSNTYKVTELNQVPAKVRVLLQDKLITRGRSVGLYLPVTSTTPGVLACTCVKNTTDSSDRSCLTCHGTKFAPGFLRFLHDSYFWCSAEASSFTLTGTSVSTAKKANVIVLNGGVLTGTIVTQDKAFTNPLADTWEVKLEAYRRATGGTFVLEFSTTSGASWTVVPLTEVANGTGFTGTIAGASLYGTGVVRFRITMTRGAIADLTPAFEIVRLRRVRTEDVVHCHKIGRPDLVPGNILILRPWVQEQDFLEPGRGRIIDHAADRTWTVPLDFFDSSLTPETPACKVDDFAGPHAFYTYTAGVQTGTRYVILKVSFNEQFGIFTHQFWDDRRSQEGEHFHQVW